MPKEDANSGEGRNGNRRGAEGVLKIVLLGMEPQRHRKHRGFGKVRSLILYTGIWKNRAWPRGFLNREWTPIDANRRRIGFLHLRLLASIRGFPPWLRLCRSVFSVSLWLNILFSESFGPPYMVPVSKAGGGATDGHGWTHGSRKEALLPIRVYPCPSVANLLPGEFRYTL
jgi:hypothetical protein